MAKTYRGQVPFRAIGRDLFVCYRTAEIALMQRCLGFAEPPGTPAKVLTEEVPALNLDEGGSPVRDKDGRALAAMKDGKVLMRTVLVDSAERRRRLIEAFDAALVSPSAEELQVMVRCGLTQWEQDNGKLTVEQHAALVEELGFAGLQMVHREAVAAAYAAMLPATEEDDHRGKGRSRGSASRT